MCRPGLVTGTATATLTELAPASAGRRVSLVATAANMAGLGLGPLVAGLFAQYAPDPTTLVFEVYLAVLAVAALILLLVPETVRVRTRPTLRFTGLGVPERGRGEFIAAGVAGFAAFALLGLFTSLVPGFIAGELHQGSHAVQGAVVFLLLAVGTVTQVALVPVQPPPGDTGRPEPVRCRARPDRRGPGRVRHAPVPGGHGGRGRGLGAIFLGSVATANRLAPASGAVRPCPPSSWRATPA